MFAFPSVSVIRSAVPRLRTCDHVAPPGRTSLHSKDDSMDTSPACAKVDKATLRCRSELLAYIGTPLDVGASTRGLLLEGRWTAADIHENHAQLHLDRNTS